MTNIKKWFINFNDILINLTFHSSSNFYYQIVSTQSIQKIKLCLTSLMSMNSALSLSSQNIILIGFIYIYHHLFTICTICRTKTFSKRNQCHWGATSQVITNWDATRDTPLGQRGATRDKSPETEV